MNNFKILNQIEDSLYWNNQDEDSPEDDEYGNGYNGRYYFSPETKESFVNSFREYCNLKQHVGHSKARGCDYIAVLIIAPWYGDGEFQSHEIKATYLINEGNTIKDSNNNTDEHGEYTSYHDTVYHLLPDGKILEYVVNADYKHNDYTTELPTIYETIQRVNSYHKLSQNLPEKKLLNPIKKI